MTTISDEQLVSYADRVKGKVVVITGGASGIGKQASLLFGKHGAKVVIGDLNKAGADAVVNQIKKAGGDAASVEVNVLNWDQLVDLFEFAITRFGAVDVVVPNAGVNETDKVCDGTVVLKDGRPVQPKLLTLQINLTAVVHTVHLGLYYMKKIRKEGDWKSVVMIGSMASWQGIPLAPQYSASKHAVLGFMRSIEKIVARDNVRVATIHPWFADTNILPFVVKLALAGIPLTPVDRIAAAIFYAATDPDPETNGLPWLLPDEGPVFRVDREQLTLGVYGLMDQRVKRLGTFAENVKLSVLLVRDLIKLFFGKSIVAIVPLLAFAYALRSGLVEWPF
ncbi:NAD(P)-binding protein [Auriscalpium vulgare]|uniref:NAD(P)-binding protein n=1 Tax=Auriscalpium vulgare TaxID=40419 RepID=A0ACB8RGD4_9AGAM|nr:NAD(P)-binding protein [Auriscalpium vulgare]